MSEGKPTLAERAVAGSDERWVVEVETTGCCRGCPDCYGEGLGCHNRPAVDLIAAARRLAEPEVAKGEADE